MSANLLMSLVNVLIIGAPIYLIWGIEIYLVSLLFQIVLIALLFWNIVGDFLLVQFVFHGKSLPQDAQMKPAITKYFHYLEKHNLVEIEKTKRMFWANSRYAYFLPISNRTFIISIALQDYLIQHGEQILISHFSNITFGTSETYSRKILLLTVLGYKIILRFLELWAIVFAFGVKFIISVAMVVANGALFGTLDDIISSISLGSALGEIALKIDHYVNYIQDSLIELFVRETVLGHFTKIEKDLSIK